MVASQQKNDILDMNEGGSCRYQSKKCDNPRAVKKNGKLHNLCEFHREKANNNQRKLDRKKRQQSRASGPYTKPETAFSKDPLRERTYGTSPYGYSFQQREHSIRPEELSVDDFQFLVDCFAGDKRKRPDWILEHPKEAAWQTSYVTATPDHWNTQSMDAWNPPRLNTFNFSSFPSQEQYSPPDIVDVSTARQPPLTTPPTSSSLPGTTTTITSNNHCAPFNVISPRNSAFGTTHQTIV